MKTRLMAVLLCVMLLVAASAMAESTDWQALYESMTVEELEESQTVLETVLNEKRVAGATLTLADGDLVIAKGKNAQLQPVCDGRELTAKVKMAYTSSDEAVATVQNGRVQGKDAGTATITVEATFEDGAVLTAECGVTVIVPVTSLRATAQKASVLVGSETALADLITVAPENATEQGLVFSCDDTDIIDLAADGTVKGLKAGTVTVNVTSAEQTDTPKTTKLTVVVGQPVTGLELSESSFNVGKGKSHTLTATIAPDDASNTKLAWSSSDPTIAKVSANGQVSGVATGKAVITCETTDGSGLKAEAEVEVITAVNSVKLKSQKLAITKGESETLAVTVLPADATNSTLKWESSNTSVATVDSNGKVTGEKVGTCTITATSTDGTEKTSSMTLYVEPRNPVSVNRITWRTTWGIKDGRVGFEIVNNCQYRKITSVSVEIECKGSYGTRTDYETYKVNIAPGKTGKTKMTYVGGFTSAYTVTVTAYQVTYSDGTVQTISTSDQNSSYFSM